MRKYKIIGVNVFLERRLTRIFVGQLIQQNGNFVFTYDDQYLKAQKIIPLGPEFPLTEKQFISKNLFPSLEDRIPSKKNPAYPEYCLEMEISPDEKDPIILLSTIGRKGPSSFIFYPQYEHAITSRDVIAFRESLSMTTREFAKIFEFSQASLNALERNRIVGSEILKRLEIILHFPKVALDLLLINGGYLSYEKYSKALRQLKFLLKHSAQDN